MVGSAFAVLAMLVTPRATQAATFVVTNTLDSGSGVCARRSGSRTAASARTHHVQRRHPGKTIKPLTQLPRSSIGDDS